MTMKTFKIKYVVEIYVVYCIFTGSIVLDDAVLFQISSLISAAVLILRGFTVAATLCKTSAPNAFWIACYLLVFTIISHTLLGVKQFNFPINTEISS